MFSFVLFYMYGCFECMYVCALVCLPGVQGCQKRMTDPLGLDLWVVISHHVGVSNQTYWVLWKSG